MRLKILLLPYLLFFCVSILLAFSIVLLFSEEESGSSSNINVAGTSISQEVETHRDTVEHYAREYEIEDHISILLAIIQVESGGTGADVMQASESLNLPPNSLSTEESIEQGTKYFSELIQSVEEQDLDVDTAIQAYNFGGAFIDYVAERGNEYSFDLAEAFAREQADGNQVTYSNPLAVEENGGWRYSYGNMFYVPLIHQFLNTPSEGEWIRPAEGMVTSPFGYRIHPIYGDRRMHTGIDIAGSGPIIAARSGTVVAASYNRGLGYFVQLDHGDGYQSVYGHMQPNLQVSIGDTIEQGQRLGTMGTTGTSTGVHLDFKILKDGDYVDPAPYIGL
ncbi:Murein DD-endopeptidase MepM and murein hydrolase activator NlpD, contain LysM domain [Marinilactibacillus piezotolerans]|jgi:murein DD-endopeptidase MepM/ murein hydrolase activator NlpD|uniref:Murein DD-endopeptidase MepM and murein hydrolase activator NlpD, contain LysM domain n=1 Tax=Marinilactibacillus piezotolerans TaxID=258723 RepID=A0A1I3X6C6_9LACT|nr:lysozyme family protein [Marinilactibacillus piezotolerans]SFK14441.1 Murein DD-endopeptidase MepM and murein hydrolase activator NlpD, contain LysM domain [Marinilactibacillus piezotolerans]